jgi:hypothetical protein
MSLPSSIIIRSERPYCTCKRSNCLKKYCVCFTAGLSCDPDKCRCVNCKDPHRTNSRVAQRPFHHIYYTPTKKHRREEESGGATIMPVAKRPSFREQWLAIQHQVEVEVKEEKQEEEGHEPLKDLSKDVVFSYIDNFFTDSTIDEYQPYS